MNSVVIVILAVLVSGTFLNLVDSVMNDRADKRLHEQINKNTTKIITKENINNEVKQNDKQIH